MPSSRCAATPSVSSIDGLMCIPPFDEEPAMHFALLAKLAERLGIKQLSMGMSGDFVRAIDVRRHVRARRHRHLRRARRSAQDDDLASRA